MSNRRVQFSELQDPTRWGGCTVCAAPLFTWEQPVGLCRTHGTDGLTFHEGEAVPMQDGTVTQEPLYRTDRLRTLRSLGSILPPIPERGMSVRWVQRVLKPTEEELRAIVSAHQPLTAAMRKVGDEFTMHGAGVDPVTRRGNGEDVQMRIVRA